MDDKLKQTDIDLCQKLDGTPDTTDAASAASHANSQLPARPATGRKVALGAKKHFSCAIVYGPDAGSVMQLESLTEKGVALLLLAREDVAGLESQVLFCWIDDFGSKRKHFFDFRVTMTDGSRVAVMVKYDKKLSDEEFRAKIACIADQVSAPFADRVTVMTEAHLDPVALHNAKLFNAVRKPDPEADAAIRAAVADLVGAVKIGDLIAHTGLAGRGFRSIARLIGAYELDLQTPMRIGYDSRVYRRTV